MLAASVASLLSLHGLRKKSLSPSGAATAFVVGFLTFAGALRVFGIALIVFYLLGSRATKRTSDLRVVLSASTYTNITQKRR